MSESTRLLKGIMKTSGWTQEQVAVKLGVSYPTMNAWVNGKSKPRQAMLERIRRLYLAQDITDEIEPIFVTLVNVPKWLKVDDVVILEKDYDNSYDDEAISAAMKSDDGEVCSSSVANSADVVVRGTSSAGRIYDKFESRARARVLFIFHKTAIARVVEWNYAEEGE